MHSGEPSPELLAEKKAVPESGRAARDAFDAEGHGPATTAVAGIATAAAGLAVAKAATVSVAFSWSGAAGDAAAPCGALVVMSALVKSACTLFAKTAAHAAAAAGREGGVGTAA